MEIFQFQRDNSEEVYSLDLVTDLSASWKISKEDYFPLSLHLYLHCKIVLTIINIGCLLPKEKTKTKLLKLNILTIYMDVRFFLKKTFQWRLLQLISWDFDQNICEYCCLS